VHPGITLGKWPTCCTIMLYKTFIIVILYMFLATPYSSWGGWIVLIRHLVQCAPAHRTVTYWAYCTRCHINTIQPPDDEHGVARNMYRIKIINVLYNVIVHQVSDLPRVKTLEFSSQTDTFNDNVTLRPVCVSWQMSSHTNTLHMCGFCCVMDSNIRKKKRLCIKFHFTKRNIQCSRLSVYSPYPFNSTIIVMLCIHFEQF